MSIINTILPKSGMSMTIADYIIAVTNLPQMQNDRYARIKAIASLGGISGRSAVISGGSVTRL